MIFQFTATPSCSNVQLERDFTVENLKPATAKVYDYYESGTIFFISVIDPVDLNLE